MILWVKGKNFTVKVNGFQFDRVLHMHPNTHQGVKYFLNFIYTHNKHNLSVITPFFLLPLGNLTKISASLSSISHLQEP